ncbi:Signal transduction histidine kinase [Maricaulis salignorans]|uniref:histidine kinase n=2 Tax=Maricaulis salignorans TaxID=144026 RepID=A0A1G9R0I0_9PROT|nr:Signal transduction histidine kinase [Maricaulis salignorans]
MSENFMLSTAVQDVFVILVLALTLFVMARNLRAISFAGISRELGLIAVGMAIWGGYHLLHLVFLMAGPVLVGEGQSVQIGTVLETWVRWACETVATILFLLGVVQLTWRFGRLMESLEQSTSALEHEHHVRTTLENELKTAVESQRESSQHESEFLLGLSHELRTPLNGIIGLGSLLGNTELDPAQRKLLATMEQSAQTMLARVGVVIDLSRLRSDQVEVRNLVFSPAELVKSIEALFAPSARDKGLVFATEISAAATKQVIGDSRLTRQLLSTLASLVIKYSPPGTIRGLIDVEEEGEGLAWVKFTAVAGELHFPPEVIERVRAEFGSMRGDGGIGLAICWRLATLMDGTLEIDSQADTGTVITVCLPMRREV